MKKNTKQKAVFLDRDGTVIYERPGRYLKSPSQVRLYKTALPALKKLQKAGYKLFIVSNQSGIGRGYFTDKEVKLVHNYLEKILKPVKIQEIVYCPHAPSDPCSCRKPEPGMGEYLIKKYNIDPALSFMLGDKKSDVDFGKNLGMRAVLLRTANGGRQIKKYGAKNIEADHTASNMHGAAKYILGQING